MRMSEVKNQGSGVADVIDHYATGGGNDVQDGFEKLGI